MPTKAAKTETMMSAALVMVRALAASPSGIARRASPVAR